MATLAVKWTGLDAFYHELQVLTADLVDEANAILLESAEAAKRDIAAAYPVKSGALRAGLKIIPARGVVLAGAELKQTAPHGWIYENGTAVRENTAGQNRGRMKPRRIFEPTAQAYRRTAMSAVMFRLYQHGASQVRRGAEDEE